MKTKKEIDREISEKRLESRFGKKILFLFLKVTLPTFPKTSYRKLNRNKLLPFLSIIPLVLKEDG